MPKGWSALKASAPPTGMGEDGDASGAVYDLGTSEEEDPVTWEALVSATRDSGESGSR
jgi:hypothetical protein